jgi:hypothetical protein
MAIKFLQNVSLEGGELQNFVVYHVTSDPDPATEGYGVADKGRLIFNSTSNVLKFYNGSNWITLSSAIGDITSVQDGNGLTGGADSGDVTLTVGQGTGITVNTNDVAVSATQTGITSILNTGLVLGRDADNQIKFGTDNQIIFRVGATDGVIFKASGEIEATKFDGDLEGNADTATVATTINATANNSINETVYLTFVDGATGTQGIETDTGLTYNPATNNINVGSITGNVTGDLQGDVQGDLQGNADTATALATARAINGVDFDGTAAITVTAAAGTLTGTTLNSSITASSLTSVGTITTGVWNGTAIASAYLDADTAHLSGTQTFSGAKTFSAALTANGNIYLQDGDGIYTTGQTYPHLTFSGDEPTLQSAAGDTCFLGDNVRVNGNLTVNGGGITLNGTGRIQGIDTVSASTDAANKAYVDGKTFDDVSNANLLDALANLESTSGAANENIVIGTDSGDTIVITGNLQVNGTTTTLDTENLTVEDNNIILSSGNTTSAVIDGAGITLEGGTGNDVTWMWSAGNTRLEAKLGSSLTSIAASTFVGNLTGDVTGNADTATKIASITNSNIVQLTATQTLTNKTLTSPTLTAPVLGTPASGNLANCTFPTLNQNTTGSAATLTTAREINGISFDGSANIDTGYADDIGDGSAASIAVTHNLGSRDVVCQVYDNSSPYDTLFVAHERTDANNVTFKFRNPPTTDQYRVVIQRVM